MLITASGSVEDLGVRRCVFYVPPDGKIELYTVSPGTSDAVLTDTVVQSLYERVDFTGTVGIVLTPGAYLDIL